MPEPQTIEMVSAHAEGEVGNVITGGVAPPPGDTLWQQMEFLQADQSLRNRVLNEPRGGVFTHVNLLVPAVSPHAVCGFLTMEPAHTPPMSGSNAMCVATVLINTGLIAAQEPVTTFNLEAAAGLVAIRATCKDGKATSVELTNVASFADQLDVKLEVPGLGTLRVDTAFGGDSFVLVKAADAGLEIVPDAARDIALMGAIITKAANEQIGFDHPTENWNHISFCQFTGPLSRSGGLVTGQSAVVIDPGKIDRSPCGTGCSARLAVMLARGEIAVGERFIGTSILGTRFDCVIRSTTKVGDRRAVIPSIKGRAWITGTHRITVDPADPFPEGYRLSDTWPNA